MGISQSVPIDIKYAANTTIVIIFIFDNLVGSESHFL